MASTRRIAFGVSTVTALLVTLVAAPSPRAQQAAGSQNVVRILKHMVSVRDNETAFAFYRGVTGATLANGATSVRPASPISPMVQQLTAAPAGVTFRATFLSIPRALDGFGFELTEFKGARELPTPRLQDPGAAILIAPVADLDTALAAAVRSGATVISSGGAPVAMPGTAGRRVIVREPNGYFVELIEGGRTPGASFGFVVADAAQAAEFYRSSFGFDVSLPEDFSADASWLRLMGLAEGHVRVATMRTPGAQLAVSLIEFHGISRTLYRLAHRSPSFCGLCH